VGHSSSPSARPRLCGPWHSTIHQMIRDGRLGSCKIGNSRRIPMTEIEAFVSGFPAPTDGGLTMSRRAHGEGSM
jgi:hypothetical protein